MDNKLHLAKCIDCKIIADEFILMAGLVCVTTIPTQFTFYQHCPNGSKTLKIPLPSPSYNQCRMLLDWSIVILGVLTTLYREGKGRKWYFEY